MQARSLEMSGGLRGSCRVPDWNRTIEAVEIVIVDSSSVRELRASEAQPIESTGNQTRIETYECQGITGPLRA
jgi:hypothetical protein